MSGLKTAAVFYNVTEAQIARAFLESNGVQAFVPDLHTAANLSYMLPLMGGVRVVVPEEQLEVAQRILRAQQNFKLVESDDSSSEEPLFELANKETPNETTPPATPLPRQMANDLFAESAQLSTDAHLALTTALKAGVMGLLVPVVPTVISFYFLGRYLRFKGRKPLSVHFWLILSIDVLSLAMMSAIFYSVIYNAIFGSHH